jgi:hypothetical protein
MTEIDNVDAASQREANRLLAFLSSRAVEPQVAHLALINTAAVMIGRVAQNDQNFATILAALTNILRLRARDFYEVNRAHKETILQ